MVSLFLLCCNGGVWWCCCYDDVAVVAVVCGDGFVILVSMLLCRDCCMRFLRT